MEQKKYQDITRLGHKSTIGVLNEGDHIIIQEKLDGANASFRRDGDIVRAYSRNNELNEQNNLGGFYQWVQENVKAEDLEKDGIYFGEWLNPHKVKYPEYQKQFFLYDIYDVELNRYISFSVVEKVAKKLNINVVPVFYDGLYQGFDHLMSFVGKTELGGVLGDTPTGEGIVVKNVGYFDRFGNQKFVKLVTDKFAEVQKQKKPKDPKITLTAEQKFVDATITEARVEKFLHKFVDEGILDEQYGIEDMGVILKNMNPRIQEDIIKEELDNFINIISDIELDSSGFQTEFEGQEIDEKQLSKAVARKVANTVKKILAQKQ
ncbi:MAG: RNA ligase family protein [Psychrobacillus sp.]